MIDPGSLAGWVTLLVLLAGFLIFWRGGGGVALGHLREANEVLTRTVKEQEAKLREAEREISELRGRTDVSLALAEALGPLIDRSSAHESRAQDRHEQQMVILQMIADRLGPDQNGDT